jgi:hypothetical protein
MTAHEISGHVELPIALMTEEQVEQLLTRFGRRPGILLDPDEVHQSLEARSEGGEPPGREAPQRRRRAVCYVFDSADWYLVTGVDSPWGGMVCTRS